MPSAPVRFQTPSGLSLEGRLATPQGTPAGLAVICHPHPVYGGSMATSVVPSLQRALVAHGWSALRFNFRGVGASEGSYGGGVGEVEDGLAALAFIAGTAPEAPFAMLGWSFGALVALQVAVADPRVGVYVAGAPPVSVRARIDLPLMPGAGFAGRALGVCGTEDEYCHPNDLAMFIAEVSPAGETRIFDGADHLFSTHRREMADAVASFVAGPDAGSAS